MNRSFINLIVESYISDNDLEFEKKNSAANQVIELMEDIKENNYDLYNYIHSLPKTKQKDFIYSLLNESFLDELPSGVNMGLSLFIILCVISLYSYLDKGPDWFQSISNFIHRITSTFSFAKRKIAEMWKRSDTAMDMVISNNYHDCINKCDVSDTFSSKKQTMVRALSKIYKEDGFPGIRRGGLFVIGKKDYLSPSQLECLINCSLDSLSSTIAKYAGLYVNCIKKSDTTYADIKIYTALDLGRLPADISTCSELRNNYKELFDNYIYILEFLFKQPHSKPNATTEYAKWMNILERKISATSENNYSKILDISKQYVGDTGSDSKTAIRF